MLCWVPHVTQPLPGEVDHCYQSQDGEQHDSKAVPVAVFLVGLQPQANTAGPDVADDGGGASIVLHRPQAVAG